MSDETTHTPGPWKVFQEKSHYAVYASQPDEWRGPTKVVQVFDQDDAHLIAAAPDLLEMAEGLLETTPGSDLEYAAREDLRAAVAKARGEQTEMEVAG